MRKMYVVFGYKIPMLFQKSTSELDYFKGQNHWILHANIWTCISPCMNAYVPAGFGLHAI